MKKTKMLFAVLFLAVLSTIIAGCGSDSNTSGSLAVTTVSLTGATIGTPYNQTLTASGGTGTLTWTWAAATGSALPAGLSLSTAGTISGTPTTAGTANFTVTVTDSATPVAVTVTKALSIVVSAPGALTVTTPSPLNAATIGTVYSQTLAASGGTGTLTWTWAAATGSALPTGLTLSAAGTISGTPTSAGTFNVNITVTDAAAATVTKAFSITVSSTVALDGAALYATNCASCHGPLATVSATSSTPIIRPSSVTAINVAIAANRGGMGSLSVLPAATISAIAAVLN